MVWNPCVPTTVTMLSRSRSRIPWAFWTCVQGVVEVGVIQEVVLLETPRLLDLEGIVPGCLQEGELVLDPGDGEQREDRHAQAQDEPQEKAHAQSRANRNAGAFPQTPAGLPLRSRPVWSVHPQQGDHQEEARHPSWHTQRPSRDRPGNGIGGVISHRTTLQPACVPETRQPC